MWNDFLSIYDPHIAWDLIGGFNCVLGAHENLGRIPPARLVCEEFWAFRDSANLVHMHTHGADFTWSNGRESTRHTEVRLDKVIHNVAWINIWLISSCKTLNKNCSYHHPLLLEFGVYVKRFYRPFRFSNAWVVHPDFLNVVQESWKDEVSNISNHIQKLMVKLKRLKLKLKN